MIKHNIDLGAAGLSRGPVAPKATDLVRTITGEVNGPDKNIKPMDVVPDYTAGEMQVMRNEHAETIAKQLIDNAAKYAGIDTGWSLAISSHENEITPWGYRHVKSAAAEGTVVLYNENTNEVQLLDENTMSEDYKAQIDKFKEREEEAHHHFKKGMELEERVAQAEAELQEHDLIQTIVDITHALLGDLPADAPAPTEINMKEYTVQTVWNRISDALQKFGDTSVIDQWSTDKDVNVAKARDLIAHGDPEGAMNLIDSLDLSDRQKRIFLYYATQNREVFGDGVQGFIDDILPGTGLQLLQDFGNVMDAIGVVPQNVIKGTIIREAYGAGFGNLVDRSGEYAEEFAKRTPEEWKNWLIRGDIFKDINDAIEATYRASWVNEGRRQYDFDTGFVPFDMALEICTDPDNIARHIERIAVRRAANATAQDIVKSLDGTLHIDDVTPYSNQIKTIIRNGPADPNYDKVVNRLAKSMLGLDSVKVINKEMQEQIDGIAHVLAHSFEYKNAWDIIKTVKATTSFNDEIADLARNLMGLGWVGGAVQKVVDGLKKISDELSDAAHPAYLTAKAVRDAAAEAMGKAQGELSMANLGEFMDLADCNIKTLYATNKATREAVAKLPAETKLDIITSMYMADLKYIRNVPVADMSDANAIKMLHRQTTELLERYDLKDSYLYKYLTTPEAKDISVPVSVFEKDTANSFTKLTNINELGQVIYDNAVEPSKAVVDFNAEMGKIYEYKYNSSIEAAYFGGDDVIRDYQESFVNDPVTWMRNADYYKSDGMNTMMRNLTDMTTHDVAIKSLEAAGLDEKTIDAMRDATYNTSFMRKTNRAFKSNANLTPRQYASRASNLAQDWVNTTFNVEVMKSETDAGIMNMLQCNTWDSTVNVQNIRNNALTLNDGYKTMNMVFYSAYVNDVTDEVESITFLTRNSNREWHTFIAQSTDEVDEFFKKHIADTADNSRITLMGCQNHGTGFNTDAKVRDWLRFNSSPMAYQFAKTLDLADETRLIKFGVQMPSEAVYEAARQAIMNSVHVHREIQAVGMLGNHIKDYSLAAPLAKDWRKCMFIEDNLPEDIKNFSEYVSSKYADWEKEYADLRGGEAHAYVDKWEVAKKVSDITDNAVNVKLVWDNALIKQVFPDAKFDFNDFELETTVKAVENGKLVDKVVPVKYDREEFYKMVKDFTDYKYDLRPESVSKVNQANISEQFRIYRDALPETHPLKQLMFTKDWTIEEKISWLFTWKDYPEFIGDSTIDTINLEWYRSKSEYISKKASDNKVMETSFTLQDFYNERYTWMLKGNNQATKIDVPAPGVFGREHVRWVEDVEEMNQKVQDLEQGIIGQRELDEYLEEHRKFKPLDPYYARVDAKSVDLFNELKLFMEEAKQDYANALKKNSPDIYTKEGMIKEVNARPMWEFTRDIRGGAYSPVNKGMALATEYRANAQVAYIGALAKASGTELHDFVSDYCHGTLVIMGDKFDKTMMASVTGALENAKDIHFDVTDKGLVRIWTDTARTTLDGARHLPMDFSYKVSGAWVNKRLNIQTKGKQLSPHDTLTINALRKYQYLLGGVEKISDSSLKVGMPVGDSKQIANRIRKLYFSDLDLPDLPKDSVYEGFCCSIIGDYSDMRTVSEFTSNNTLVNLANSLYITRQTNRNLQALTDAMFSQGPNGAEQVRMLVKQGAYSPEMAKEYTLVQWDGGVIRKLDINKVAHSTDVYHGCCLMSNKAANEFMQQVREVSDKAVPTDGLKAETYKLTQDWHAHKKTSKMFQWADTYHNAMISTYLYSNLGTGAHNIYDSTFKAILSNDSATYLDYMQEAMHLNKVYEKCEQDIVADFKLDMHRYEKYTSVDDIDDKIVKMYFDSHGGKFVDDKGNVITEKRFRDLRFYHQTGVASEGLESWSDVEESMSKRKVRHFDEYLEDLKKSYVRNGLDPNTISVSAARARWFMSEVFSNENVNINARIFGWAESTNRLAIYLQQIDSGHTFKEAGQKIAESQFDYRKNAVTGKVNKLIPFIQFKLDNLCYWFNAPKRQFLVGDILKGYDFTPDTYHQDPEDNEYYAWLYTLDKTPQVYEYDSIEDYKGATQSTAIQNGWIKIGDTLYFKAGLSIIDAASGQGEIFIPTKNMFVPIATAFRSLYSMIRGEVPDEDDAVIKAMDALGMDGVDILSLYDQLEDEGLKATWHDNYFNITSCIPVVGTLLSRVMQSVRNYITADRYDDNLLERALVTLSADLFAIAKQDDPNKLSYLDRPVGYDWYNQDEEYRKTHRYITGVSYVPTWVAKDPATYINTYGRLQQLGMTSEQVQQLMQDGGAFWFTKNNEGEYKLHNYKLMIQDKDAQYRIFQRLLSFGWTIGEALRLLEEASEPTWTVKPKRQKGGLKSPYTSLQGYRRYANSPIRYQMMPNQLGDRMRRGKNVLIGSYEVAKPRVQHNRIAKSYLHWHRRERDIYKENYAKYGASRMAMTQNLKNYSNKSIVQLHREEQQQRYARIHRHQRW